jgi:hypothetical protein
MDPCLSVHRRRSMNNKLRRILAAAIILLVCIEPMSFAKSESRTWRGYLIDKQCAKTARADSRPLEVIKTHRTDCALRADCASAGFSIYSDDRWLDLDKHGNELAIKTLKASKRMAGCFVEVSGSVSVQVFQAVEVGTSGKVQVTGTRESQVLKTTKMREIANPAAKWSI